MPPAPEPVLRVQGVSKRYPLYRSPGHRLAHAFLGNIVKAPMAHVALEDVSFALHPGDALAVIGRNGAGKSTLLQILSGVLDPSEGSVQSSGRVAGLLELGSGFNPEFSGRENIYVNGAILGLSELQMRQRIDAIIAFADIGNYIDQPVKTYSSGMFLRLAFAVAIHAEPSLLLVDEALTVGDVFFQQKCYTRLGELREKGMTVLLVTHSMADAAEFCNRGLVLSQGRMVFEGGGKEAVEYYFHHERETPTGRTAAPKIRGMDTSAAHLPIAAANAGQETKDILDTHLHETVDLGSMKQFGQATIRARRLLVTDTEDRPRRVFHQGDRMRVHVEFEMDESVSVPLVGVQLMNAKGILVHGRNSLQFEDGLQLAPAGTTLRCIQEIQLDVDAGEYTLETGIAELSPEMFALRDRSVPPDIAPHIRLLCHVPHIAAISVIYRHRGFPCLFSHYGLADLPGKQSLHLVGMTASHAP